MHNEVKEENVSVCARTECEDQKTKKITGSIFPLALEVHTYMYVYIETYIDRCLRLRRTLSRMSSSFEDGQESTFVIACTHNGEPAGYSRWLRQQVLLPLSLLLLSSLSRSETGSPSIISRYCHVITKSPFLPFLYFPIKIPGCIFIDRLKSPGNFRMTDANIHITFRI